jgi:hypothetical protein
MKRIVRRLGRPSPAMIVAIVALIAALSGNAVAHHGIAGVFKLANFNNDSRDRLAGTGVIEYATQSHKTGEVDLTKPQDFQVTCGAAKKATSGGFNWIGDPPPPASYQILAAYPFGGGAALVSPGGYKVRIYILAPEAVGKEIQVYSNCVKSRKQLGTPPAL